MATETLTIERGGRGLISLLQRAVALQDRAMARFSTVSDTAVDVFVTTPFAVIAARGRLLLQGWGGGAGQRPFGRRHRHHHDGRCHGCGVGDGCAATDYRV